MGEYSSLFHPCLKTHSHTLLFSMKFRTIAAAQNNGKTAEYILNTWKSWKKLRYSIYNHIFEVVFWIWQNAYIHVLLLCGTTNNKTTSTVSLVAIPKWGEEKTSSRNQVKCQQIFIFTKATSTCHIFHHNTSPDSNEMRVFRLYQYCISAAHFFLLCHNVKKVISDKCMWKCCVFSVSIRHLLRFFCSFLLW